MLYNRNKKQETEELQLHKAIERDEFYPLIQLVRKPALEQVEHGVLAYKGQWRTEEEVHATSTYGEMFSQLLSELLPHVGGSNPEALMIMKENINEILRTTHYTYDDTYGLEPLQSNFAIASTFLDIYEPVDAMLRLYSAVKRLQKKEEKKRKEEELKQSKWSDKKKRLHAKILDELLAQPVLAEKQLYRWGPKKRSPLLKDGRAVHSVNMKEKMDFKHARKRQNRRNELFDNNVPLVKIEYYTVRKKRKTYLEYDRKVLQRMGEWHSWDERRFPSTPPYKHSEMERLSSRKGKQGKSKV